LAKGDKQLWCVHDPRPPTSVIADRDRRMEQLALQPFDPLDNPLLRRAIEAARAVPKGR
jgi:hypothetical protein